MVKESESREVLLKRCVFTTAMMSTMIVVIINYKAASTSFIATDVGPQNDSILNNLHASNGLRTKSCRDTEGYTIHAIYIMGGADKSSRSTVDASHHNQFRSTIPA